MECNNWRMPCIFAIAMKQVLHPSENPGNATPVSEVGENTLPVSGFCSWRSFRLPPPAGAWRCGGVFVPPELPAC